MFERQQLEALVGAEGIAFAGEHAGRVFALALEGEGAGGVGEAARHVVQHQPLEDLAVVLVLRQGDLADRGAGRDLVVSAVRISLSRIFTTYSSPA
jgi:hypothetical protein